MNTIIIFLKIIATIAVIILAKDTRLLTFGLTDGSAMPGWWREFIKILLLTIIAILMIWVK